MWEKINKVKGAIALAIAGTAVITIFIMAVIVVAMLHGKWDLADKWITMLFTSLVSNAFLGFLYVKTNQSGSSEK